VTTLYLVGDVFDRVAELRRRRVRVALVLCSPPFLALRSYLPDGHPLKASEIGSEATPAAFIDVMLALVAELAHVLEPWGSLAFELGDTFAGSGGSGGDYDEDGWRAGQQRFRATGVSGSSAWTYPDALWLAALIDAEGAIYTATDKRDDTDRLTPAVAVGMNERQMLDRAQAITGVGRVRPTATGFTWTAHAQQARYVLSNVWQHLMVKQPQACAAIEMARHIEENRFGRGRPITADAIAYRERIRRFIMNRNDKGGNKGRYPDDWVPPTPTEITHHLGPGGTGWPLPKSLCAIPQLFEVALAYGVNPLTGHPSPAGRWLVRNLKPWIRSNPPVGALGDKERPATSYITVATRDAARYFDLDAVRTAPSRPREGTTRHKVRDDVTPGTKRGSDLGEFEQNNPAGAPPRDWWHHVDAVLDACLDDMAGKAGGGARSKVGGGRLSWGGTGGGGDQDKAGEWIDSDRTTGARGVHLRRALERAGILATVDAIDRSPKGYRGAHYAVWPPELVKQLVLEMCPRRVCTTCGQPSRRITEATPDYATRLGSSWADKTEGRGKAANGARSHHAGQPVGSPHITSAERVTTGWSDCGHGTFMPGRVLDPFVGSGTTLQVCTGLGRDSIGIDLDYTNVGLAMERVGMWLDVEWPEPDLSLPALGAGSPHRSSYDRWARLTGDVWHVWGSDDEPAAQSVRLAGEDDLPLPAAKPSKRRAVPAVAGQSAMF
jgi:hypothetical protein